MLKFKKLLYLVCLALVLASLLFVSPAMARIPLSNPDNPADAKAETEAIREFEREERVRKEVEKERGSPSEHVERAFEDFAKGQIEAFLNFTPWEASGGAAGFAKVYEECVGGCHKFEWVEKLQKKLDGLGTSGYELKEKEMIQEKLRQLEKIDNSVIIKPTPTPSPSAPSQPDPMERNIGRTGV